MASLSPTLHSVCTSDFVTELWIEIFSVGRSAYHPLDWFSTAASQFRLLSNLCKLAKTTVDEIIDRFHLQHLVSTNLLSETDFYTQVNFTINQLIQSTKFHYHQLITTMELLTQVDQPLVTPLNLFFQSNFNAKLELQMIGNMFHNETTPSVSDLSLIKNNFIATWINDYVICVQFIKSEMILLFF